MQINRFNLRVYFILQNEIEDSILVSDEIIRGKHYTKFPGGGLEFGESTIECVKREAIEELGQSVNVVRHFYTTDIFVPSAFRSTDQIISIYYIASLNEPPLFKTSENKFDFKQSIDDEESFRWVKLSALDTNNFAFAADKRVVELLMTQGFND
jgi:8-oxo-dGTP diphosphatase